jgi:hypothetical protein
MTTTVALSLTEGPKAQTTIWETKVNDNHREDELVSIINDL